MRGKGSNNDIAKNNAINLVAKETAKRLVALINSKGINWNREKNIIINFFNIYCNKLCNK